jgi:hypothetical protein
MALITQNTLSTFCMWKIIESAEMFDNLSVGNIIANNPDGSGRKFEIKGISDGIIKGVYSDGIVVLKLLTEKELLSGNWWVKMSE